MVVRGTLCKRTHGSTTPLGEDNIMTSGASVFSRTPNTWIREAEAHSPASQIFCAEVALQPSDLIRSHCMFIYEGEIRNTKSKVNPACFAQLRFFGWEDAHKGLFCFVSEVLSGRASNSTLGPGS